MTTFGTTYIVCTLQRCISIDEHYSLTTGNYGSLENARASCYTGARSTTPTIVYPVKPPRQHTIVLDDTEKPRLFRPLARPVRLHMLSAMARQPRQ